MNQKAVQDYYPPELSHCFGCGRLNEYGYQLKSYLKGNETVARFTPKEYHISIPGYVYGGLIASLIDCHGTGTAAIAKYLEENRPFDSLPSFRFVTASLCVDYIKPTPLGVELELRGKILEVKDRKVTSEILVIANGEVCAKGKVIAVQVKENFLNKLKEKNS